MKKISLKLDADTATGLNAWLEHLLPIGFNRKMSFADKCVIATVAQWRINKLLPKTHFPQPQITLKLDAPTAMALAEIITTNPIASTTFLEYKLLRILGDIDQHFK